MREWFRIMAACGGRGGGEILLYGLIGAHYGGDAVDAAAFVRGLDRMVAAGPGDVHVRIASVGGDVGDGVAIYNAIRRHRARCVCTVESVAFSIASVIAMAGRRCRMCETGSLMIHNPTTKAEGDEAALLAGLASLRSAREVLVTAYAAKSGKSREKVAALMSATTFMTAAQALEFGFVDEVLTEASAAATAFEPGRIAACLDVAGWERFYRGVGSLPGVAAVMPGRSKVAPRRVAPRMAHRVDSYRGTGFVLCEGGGRSAAGPRYIASHDEAID